MTTHNPADEWGKEASNILVEDKLALIRQTLEQSPIIVEHWFYCRGCAPDRLVFDDYEQFEEYLKSKVAPGDSIWTWRFDALCKENNALVHGKYPDESGLVPKKGAY